MAEVTLEVGTERGEVVLTFILDGEEIPFRLDPDTARDLCNSIGGAIKFVTTGVMT